MLRSQSNRTTPFSTFFRRFAVLFAPLMVLFLIISLFVYHLESANYLEIIASKEKVVVRTGLQLIHDTIYPIKDDLGFLADLCSNNYLTTHNTQQSQAEFKGLEKTFLLFAANHPIYDQVRFLDPSGLERIRINFNKEKPVIVQINALQDKGDRYYFKDIIQLNKGEVFISPLDLTIEYRAIEYPLKPMIRLGEVVVDTEGKKLG